MITNMRQWRHDAGRIPASGCTSSGTPSLSHVRTAWCQCEAESELKMGIPAKRFDGIGENGQNEKRLLLDNLRSHLIVVGQSVDDQFRNSGLLGYK